MQRCAPAVRGQKLLSVLRLLLLSLWRLSQVGSVVCNTCNERFSAKIHKLSEAVDVYSEWIDACEVENNA